MLSDIQHRLRALFRRGRVEAEIDEELRFHIERQTEKYVHSGMGPEDARRRARIELGGVEQTKEECRDARGVNFIETTIRDVRYGLRQLRRSPGFTVVAILTLALGIGANTAIFSVVDGVLLRPLPIPDPGRVVELHNHLPGINMPSVGVSALQFRDYSAYTDVFTSAALLRHQNFNVTVGGRTQRLLANRVTASLFPLLGIRPILGRTFTRVEDTKANVHVAVLSADVWRGMFGSDPRVLGKSIWLDGIDYRVIGVLPESMAAVDSGTQLWVPMGLTPKDFTEDNRWTLIFHMLARLRPGTGLEQARAAMSVEAGRMKAAAANDRQHTGILKGFGILVNPLPDELVGNVRQPLYLLLGAVFLVLLIACANVANLLLVRGSARSRELAIRVAVGAGRRRIISQLLIESALLSFTGCILGVLLASWSVKALIHFAPASLPHASAIRIDPPVLAFALVVAVLAGMLFGLAPAIRASRIDLAGSLKESGAGGIASRHAGLRRVLILCEVAITFVLLVASGLLLRSLRNLLDVNLGFNSTNVLTMRISPSDQRPDPARVASFSDALLDRVSALPGVAHAALALDPPLFDDENNSLLAIRGYHPGLNEPQPHADWVDATPDYFAAMRIPLLRGRIYTQSEMGRPWNKGLVVVIDQALAKRFWPGKNPIGQQIGWEDNGGQWATIIGVVGTVRESGLVAESRGMIYFPWYRSGATLVVRAVSDPRALAGALRAQVEAVDPGQAVYDVKTMGQRVAESAAQQRFTAELLGLFAALALLLATVGLYGVMAYVVSHRTHDIGVRVALGAEKGDIVGMVVGQGLSLAAIGIAIGIGGALVLTRFLSSLLYGVKPTDSLTFVIASLILIGIALVACYFPARRAMRIDPAIALRHE